MDGKIFRKPASGDVRPGRLRFLPCMASEPVRPSRCKALGKGPSPKPKGVSHNREDLGTRHRGSRQIRGSPGLRGARQGPVRRRAYGHHRPINSIAPMTISTGRRMLDIVSKMCHHAEHLGKQRLSIVRALSLSCIHVNSLFCFRAFRKETSPCRCLD